MDQTSFQTALSALGLPEPFASRCLAAGLKLPPGRRQAMVDELTAARNGAKPDSSQAARALQEMEALVMDAERHVQREGRRVQEQQDNQAASSLFDGA